MVQKLGADGTEAVQAGDFNHVPVGPAQVLADLETAGLFEKAEKHKLKVPRGDRTGVVIEPMLRSQRPPQLPAVIVSQPGVTNFTFTPSRFAISVATSMSKPTKVPSGCRNDCGW